MANIPVPGHAVVLARLALQFVAAVHEMETADRNDVEGFDEGDVHLEVRVGINSGPVTGGVIGKLLPRFRLFGDTVNTAARMETTSEPGRVQLSPSTVELLRKGLPSDLALAERGVVDVKGKVRARWRVPESEGRRRRPNPGQPP